jgi:hypothetical protein
MLKNALTHTLALGLSLAPLALASAQTAPPTYVFTAVDSLDIHGDDYGIEVTGVLQGENAPRTIKLTYYPSHSDYAESARTFERCERLALLAMNKPGRYLLTLRQEHDYIGCALTRVP